MKLSMVMTNQTPHYETILFSNYFNLYFCCSSALGGLPTICCLYHFNMTKIYPSFSLIEEEEEENINMAFYAVWKVHRNW